MGVQLVSAVSHSKRYSQNFLARQKRDGSGVLRHYGTLEAIRSRPSEAAPEGLTVGNSQCFASGFARCSKPRGRKMDGTLPLTTLSEVLEGTGLFDLVALETEAHPEGTWKVAYFDTSGLARRNGQPPKTEAAIVGRDPSSLSGGRFVLPLSEEEVASVAARLSVGRIRETAKELLRPEVVKQALKHRNLEVVPSSEYRATRLSEENLKAHKDAGGRTSTVDRGWGESYEANLQFFRADLQGEVIVRQGDWFFLPVPRSLEVEEDLEAKRASSVDPGRLRRDVPDLGAHLPGRGDPLVSSGDCLFVRGLIRHARKDHHAVNLGDRWHLAVQADRQAVAAPSGGRSGGRD